MKTLKGTTFSLDATPVQIEREHIDETERRVPIAISSENPVRDWWGTNVLKHDKDAIDLTRAEPNGFPLLWRHGEDIIGRVKNIEIGKDKVLRGVAHFANSELATEKWGLVRDGVLTDISVGGSFLSEPEEQEDGTYITHEWAVNEVSIVPVPADPSVGVNREHDEPRHSADCISQQEGVAIMADENTSGGKAAPSGDDVNVNVANFKLARKQIEERGKQEGRRAERSRISEIRDLFAFDVERGQEYVDLMNECIDKGVGVQIAKDALLDMLRGEQPGPIASDFLQREDTGALDPATLSHVPSSVTQRAQPYRQASRSVVGGQDSMDKFVEGATMSLLAKGGIEKNKDELKRMRENEFYSMSLSELGREYLRLTGANVSGIHDKRTLMGEAITRTGIISHSSSDFSNLLANVASKSLQNGYDEAPETWQTWCRVGSLPDFRASDRPQLSTFADLEIVYENGEYKSGTFSDFKETLTLVTYGKLFNISRQALINDDTNAFTRIPQSMGRAAARVVGDLAYAVLTGNPTLNQDSNSLFDASNHSNYVTSGAAPSVTTIDAAMTAMATQTDPAGNTLNIQPSYLIVPVALKATAMTLMAAQNDPSEGSSTSFTAPNPFQNAMEVVADPRLDSFNSSGWFVAANPNLFDTVEVAFLDGNQTPYLESQDGWRQDGVEYKVRMDAVAAPLDYRGLYYNDGVT